MQTIKTRPRTETAKGESAHAHEGKPHQVKLILAFAAIYLIWGSTALGVRIAIETIPPFCLSGTRFFVAGCLIYLWLRWRGVPRPIWQELLPAVMSGILLLALGSGANAFALKTMPSGLVTLLSATVPISLALLDWLRPRGNKPSAQVIFSFVIAIAGVLLLASRTFEAGQLHVAMSGLGCAALSSLSTAAGALYLKFIAKPTSSAMLASLQMLTAGVILLVVSGLTGETTSFDLAHVSFRSQAALLYLVIFGSLIAYSCYVWLIAVVGPSKAVTNTYVNPVIAVILGSVLADETVTLTTLLAAALIITAAWLTISDGQTRKAKKLLS
jgi:drug/metabolite transporter (DMT)-like permease